MADQPSKVNIDKLSSRELMAYFDLEIDKYGLSLEDVLESIPEDSRERVKKMYLEWHEGRL